MVFCHPLLNKNMNAESIVQESVHFSEKVHGGSTSDFSDYNVICVSGSSLPL